MHCDFCVLLQFLSYITTYYAVSMVIAIACNMRVFVLIMVMALFGFSQGFWLLSHRGDHLPFGECLAQSRIVAW